MAWCFEGLFLENYIFLLGIICISLMFLINSSVCMTFLKKNSIVPLYVYNAKFFIYFLFDF